MVESKPTPHIKLLEIQILRFERLKPSAGNMMLLAKSPGVALERLLGPDARAVTEYKRLLERVSPKDQPEKVREEVLHYLRTVLDQLKHLVPTAYRAADVPVTVFLGHGRSSVWLRVKEYVEKELGLPVNAFETEPRTSQHIIEILTRLLSGSDLAVIVLTAEDLTAGGGIRARQNVIHEAGLFQGRLGFERVILLEQTGIEEPSNLAGLQTIRFNHRVEESFYDLRRILTALLLRSGG